MNSTSSSRPRVGVEAVALAFAGVPYSGPPEQVARSCVEAVRALTGSEVHLRIPGVPTALSIGDPPEGLVSVALFPTAEGEGELRLGAPELAAPARRALAENLRRVWSAQAERSQLTAEIERLRFHLDALRQVAHTLAAVRGAEETERLTLDFVRELFFAWWGALYRPDEASTFTCRAETSLRQDRIPATVPEEWVRDSVLLEGKAWLLEAREAAAGPFPDDTAAIVPLELEATLPGLLLLGPRMTGEPYEQADLALLQTLADSSSVALRNADLLDRLKREVSVDPLTGCLNRRGFTERLEAEIARARRYRRPLTVVLLDLDRFKLLNDEEGHEAGDYALKRLGSTLRRTLRTSDYVCRYGGEEFALLCPETTKADSLLLAERIRRTIAGLEPDELIPRRLTASFGTAALPDDAPDAAELLRAADRALYRAKADGRDCVRTAEPGEGILSGGGGST